MTTKDNAFIRDLLGEAERIDLLDRRGTYEDLLDDVKEMQAMGIDDESIELLLDIRLHPSDRQN